MSDPVLPISGLVVAHAQGGMKSDVEQDFEFKVGISRFSGTVYGLVEMSAADNGMRVEVGLLVHVAKKVGLVLAELPDEELLNRITHGYIEHILFDASAAALRQVAAIMAAEIQIPTQTVQPKFYMLEMPVPDSSTED